MERKHKHTKYSSSDDSSDSSCDSYSHRKIKCNKHTNIIILKGNIGPTGEKGPNGDMGPTGEKGCKGDMGPTGEKGCKGDMGPTGEKGCKGDMGISGVQGPAGPAGQQGPAGVQGPAGPAGQQGPAGPAGTSDSNNSAIITFATSESVGNKDFIGLGNSSNDMLRNTILIPYNCTVNSIAFSIRELAGAVPYTATLYVNGFASSLQCTIPDGSLNYKMVNSANLTLSQLDMVSIYITFINGALSNGACISLVVSN